MKRFLFLAFLLLSACTTTSTKIVKNEYDGALSRYANRITPGKTNRTKLIKKMEAAYHTANTFDWHLVDSLLSLEGEAHWPAVNYLHRRIKRREERISQLMPIKSKDGYEPVFQFSADITRTEQESRAFAAAFLYQQAETLLQMAHSGNRLIARQAYAALDDLQKNFIPNYQNTTTLMEEARQLGTTWILVSTSGNTFNDAASFWRDFARSGYYISDSEWHKFDETPVPGRQYHYQLNLHLQHINIGSEYRQESSSTCSKEVQDGETVKKDSCGRVIERTPIMKTITATVTEVTVTKNANATVQAILIDYATNKEVGSQHFYESISFSESGCTISGDSRATDAICSMSLSIAAPSDWSMESDLACRFRWPVGNFVHAYTNNL